MEQYSGGGKSAGPGAAVTVSGSAEQENGQAGGAAPPGPHINTEPEACVHTPGGIWVLRGSEPE